LKLSPADDAAVDFHEWLLDDDKALKSNAWAPEGVQPGKGMLDDSVGLSEAADNAAHDDGRFAW
jgi:hypothetical protein